MYIGLVHIQGMGEALREKIIQERNEHGSYQSLFDFMERSQIGLEHLNVLIRTGALRFTGKSKKELLWEANFLHRHQKVAPRSPPHSKQAV